MMPPRRLALVVVALAVGLPLGWRTAKAFYFTPKAELRERIDTLNAQIARQEETLETRSRLDTRLKRIVDRTLGSDVETVDHHVRTRLNRIAEEIGLTGAAVSTKTPSAKRTPATSRFPGNARREMREELDFVELEVTVSGEGTLQQAIALVDRIAAEPWIKRTGNLRIDPKQNGERFGVTLQLATLFLPGREPAAHEVAAYDPARLTRFARLFETNPFHLPPPPAPAPPPTRQAERPTPPSPPAFQYGQWVVTGVAQGASTSGGEVWLKHRTSGETRRLALGEKLHEAVLLAVEVDAAVFAIHSGPPGEVDAAAVERQFIVGVGQHLGDRTRSRR